jgi:hypothetical protein
LCFCILAGILSPAAVANAPEAADEAVCRNQ